MGIGKTRERRGGFCASGLGSARSVSIRCRVCKVIPRISARVNWV